MLITDDRLQYLVLEKDKNKLLHLCCYQVPAEFVNQNDWVSGILASDELIKNSFHSTEIYFHNASFTLIPFSLFDESNQSLFSENNGLIKPDSDLLTERFKELELVILFSVHRQLKNVLNEYFPGAIIHHSLGKLIVAGGNCIKENSEQLFINIQSQCFEIIYFNNSKFQFANTFKYSNTEDFLYFTILVIKQLLLDVNKTEIILSGDILPDSELFRKLNKYVRSVKFSSRPSEIIVSKEFKLLPHFQFLLFSVAS